MNQLKVRVGNNGIQQCHALSLSRRYFTFFVDVLWSPHDSASYTVLHAAYKCADNVKFILFQSGFKFCLLNSVEV